MSHESYGARESAHARASICQFVNCIMSVRELYYATRNMYTIYMSQETYG